MKNEHSDLRQGTVAFWFVLLGLILFFLAMRAATDHGYKYTDDAGCKHYDDGYIERIECGDGKK